MQKKRLLWQLFPSYLIITLLTLLAASLYAAQSIHHFYINQLAAELFSRGKLLEQNIEEKVSAVQYLQLNDWLKQIGSDAETRITVILPSGKVIADSMHDPVVMDNHSDRPEVIRVLQGEIGQAERYSYTLHEKMMYVAMPVKKTNRIIAVLRMAISVGGISQALHDIYLQLSLAGLAIAGLATILSLMISRRITRPLEEMRRGADRFARGELNWRMPIPDTEEMAVLACSLNAMAEQLDERVRTLMRQRNEQQAVLSSMVEGVLAIDSEEQIISINNTCARLLGVQPELVIGRSIQEAVRNSELQEFINRVMTATEPIETEIILRDNGTRFLQAHGTVLNDERGNGIRAVIVLNDLTRLHRLETVRRDFVANVSHELKTPIASIKGFVETLLDGAIEQPEDARRFLEIIARQTDRLIAIIEDILSLSRIEDQSEKERIQLEKIRVCEVIQSAVQVCHLQAQAKDIQVEFSCDENLLARINGPLMEQAVVNLLDNAIKYSDQGKKVRIEVKQTPDELSISVRDMGCGIAREHLPRLFERFYRVDRARSRKIGGTGLGLSIVKHIALIHKGSVTVESIPNQGSTFIIHIPAT